MKLKATRKPSSVDVFRYDGTNPESVHHWRESFEQRGSPNWRESPDGVVVRTRHGEVTASHDDYIIRETNGDYLVYKTPEFQERFDLVKNEAEAPQVSPPPHKK